MNIYKWGVCVAALLQQVYSLKIMYKTETFGCDAARKKSRRGEEHAQVEGSGVCKEQKRKHKIAVGRLGTRMEKE